MVIAAQGIVLEAQTALQDLTGTRWPASELVRHLNDGQRVISTKRPDSTATLVDFSCVEGAHQMLPNTAQTLIDVHTNANGRAVTKVDRHLLEATSRSWTTTTKAAPIHFMYSLAEPRAFYVYPPATSGTTLSCVFSVYPTDVAAPTAPGKLYTTVTGNISLPDEFEMALLHYVLFRAYSKDAEFGGNAALATNHYQLFKAEIGEQVQGVVSVAPKE